MNNFRPFAAVALGIALVACTQSPPDYLESPTTGPVGGAVTHSPPEGDEAAVIPLPEGAVRIDPLATCEAGQVTTVHWTDAAVANGPIKFWIEGDPPALFAESASAGSKQTGAWAQIGQVFRVTDASGRTLARVVVEADARCD